MQFFKKLNIDFLGKRYIFIWVSLILNVVGLIAPWAIGLRFGIDFEGGTEAQVLFSAPVDIGKVRHAMDVAKFDGAEIKSFGADNEVLIRVHTIPGMNSAEVQSKIMASLQSEFPGLTLENRGGQTIEPKVGKELRVNALIAIVLSVIAIMLYLAFRFEFTFGLGAAIALVHDVLVTLAIVALVSKTGIINLEINQAMIAAFLTVIGFSVHDTVIIFDRVREDKDKYKGLNLIQLMNQSINETMSRTVNTVLTVVLVLLTIVLFGGEVLEGFAFTMLVGILTGTYSSIYVATAFVVWYVQHVQKVDVEGDYKKVLEKSARKLAAGA